jgi:F-type H+-transporting ATPase subunit b
VHFAGLLQEGGGGGLGTLGFDLPSLIVYLVNFCLLLAILYYFAYKPFLNLMDERSRRIKEGLDAAEKAKEESARIQADMERQLEEAHKEGQQFIERTRAIADRYLEEERETARREVETYLERARADIQRERDEAMQEVRRHFAELVSRASEQIIGRALDEKSHLDIIDDVLSESNDLGNGKSA